MEFNYNYFNNFIFPSARFNNNKKKYTLLNAIALVLCIYSKLNNFIHKTTQFDCRPDNVSKNVSLFPRVRKILKVVLWRIKVYNFFVFGAALKNN